MCVRVQPELLLDHEALKLFPLLCVHKILFASLSVKLAKLPKIEEKMFDRDSYELYVPSQVNPKILFSKYSVSGRGGGGEVSGKITVANRVRVEFVVRGLGIIKNGLKNECGAASFLVRFWAVLCTGLGSGFV